MRRAGDDVADGREVALLIRGERGVDALSLLIGGTDAGCRIITRSGTSFFALTFTVASCVTVGANVTSTTSAVSVTGRVTRLRNALYPSAETWTR
jgi:hypothetical protein